ncbi:MAG: hypothetical protein JWP12_3233 [Bacteroidetes bacterium]|nr:hypothetical protein [Bacteroidota bacterium]
MNIPSVFYGKAADVKKRVKQIVNEFSKGKPWDELLGDKFIDTNSSSGLIVIDGPSKLLGNQEHFHMYTLMRHVLYDSKIPEGSIEKFFSNSIETNWGLLLLLNYQNFACFDGKDQRRKLFLRAANKQFDSLVDIGSRYSSGLPDPKNLAELPNAIYYCLSLQGIDVNKVITGSRDMKSLHELLKDFYQNVFH